MHHFADIGLGPALVDDGQVAAQLLGQCACAHHTADVGRDHDQVFVIASAQVTQQHRRGVNIVHRDVEETLDLVGVQVHGQHAGDANRLQHVGHHLAGNRHPAGTRTAVLTRITEVGDHRADALGRGALERVDHDDQLHQVFVGRRAGGLNDEHVTGTHVLVDLDRHFTVGEAADMSGAQLYAQMASNFGGQSRIGVAGEDHEVGLGRRTGRSLHAQYLCLPKLAKCLAEEEGFEPSNAGIKIRCLNQLGDSPTRVNVVRYDANRLKRRKPNPTGGVLPDCSKCAFSCLRAMRPRTRAPKSPSAAQTLRYRNLSSARAGPGWTTSAKHW